MPSYIKSLKSNLGDLIIPRTTATAVTYDNSTSGLESINAQDAIDEMMGKGWISSDDSVPSDPAAINADSLGGLPAADYATNESVDNKISSLDADSVNAANKDLSNLSDYQKALHNIGGRPNRNFLRNSFFIGGGDAGVLPVNQRGQKEYNNVQSIDGWSISGNGGQKAEIQSDGILLTSTAQYGAYFAQIVDPSDLVQLRGKTVTLSSFLGDDTGFIGGMAIYINDTYFSSISANPNDINFGTFVVPETASRMYVQFGANGAGTCKAKACKLEEGEIQTLGWKDSSGGVHLFETSNYGAELAQCQRYLIVETAENEKPGTAYSNTSGVFTISTAVQMRTTPVLSELKGYEPKIALSDGSTVLITKEEITVLGADVSGVRIRVDVTGDKTLKLGPASIRDCNMVLSAEL